MRCAVALSSAPMVISRRGGSGARIDTGVTRGKRADGVITPRAALRGGMRAEARKLLKLRMLNHEFAEDDGVGGAP